jgi:hypothetical protein
MRVIDLQIRVVAGSSPAPPPSIFAQNGPGDEAMNYKLFTQKNTTFNLLVI